MAKMTAASSRALNAILPQIPTAPYEAHQKARTFAARYVKSNQYDTAIDVLFQSARELFMNGQPGSGSDLTGFLLEVYETKGETLNDESRGKFFKLSPKMIVDFMSNRETHPAHSSRRALWRLEENNH
jgi:hypothetical protein